MDNKDKIILHLCASEFGSDTKDYKAAGYDVRYITKEIGVENYHPPKNVYGIIANPPCTEFSKAKSTKPRDLESGMKTVYDCLRIIWETQYDGHKLAFWSLENPTGLLRRFLGNPFYTYKQWWFGDDKTKDTDLWGRFIVPKRTVFTPPKNLLTTKGYLSKEGKPLSNRNAKWYSNIRGDKRLITSPYFTKAFFEANH